MCMYIIWVISKTFEGTQKIQYIRSDVENKIIFEQTVK